MVVVLQDNKRLCTLHNEVKKKIDQILSHGPLVVQVPTFQTRYQLLRQQFAYVLTISRLQIEQSDYTLNMMVIDPILRLLIEQ